MSYTSLKRLSLIAITGIISLSAIAAASFHVASAQEATGTGYLDGFHTRSNILYGWAVLTGEPEQTAFVDIYVDGPIGEGTLIGSISADIYRQDVVSAGYQGSHGFEFSIPNEYLDGTEHTYHLYATDPFDGDATELSNSPINVSYYDPGVSGWVDRVVTANDTTYVEGWAYENISPSASSSVFLFANGGFESGIFLDGTNTNIFRDDVNDAFGIVGNQGFQLEVPSWLTQGELAVYALNRETGQLNLIGTILVQ